MEYIVQLYSGCYNILSDITFNNKTKAFIYIGEIITCSKVTIEIKSEKIYSTKDDIKILNTMIYKLYYQE